jgi:hypothetical protein
MLDQSNFWYRRCRGNVLTRAAPYSLVEHYAPPSGMEDLADRWIKVLMEFT